MSVESANTGVGGKNNPADEHPVVSGLDFDAATAEWDPSKDEAIYKANDIKKHEDSEYFVNVKGGEKYKKEIEKKARLEREHARAEQEKKIKEDADMRTKIAKEHDKAKRRAARKTRLGKVSKFIKRHAVLILVVIALTAGGVAAAILVPKINANIAAEKEDKFVKENNTLMLDVFAEVVGKDLTVDQISQIVAKYSGEIEVKYYEQNGLINPIDDFEETIYMTPGDQNTYTDFIYRDSKNDAYLQKINDKYEYSLKDSRKYYQDANEAVRAYILEVKKGEQ